jgi:uncharacterized protein YyaL (SSP411 family)
MAVTGLLRLARLTGRTDLQEKAEKTLDLFHGVMSDHPLAAGQMLIALDFHLGPVREIVVLGDPVSEPYREALRLIRSRFRPRTVLAGGEADLPLLAGRRADRPLAVFVCENGTCQSPVHTIADLELVLSPTSR